MGKTSSSVSTTPVVYSLGLASELSCNALIQLYSRILESQHLLTQNAFLMLIDNYSTSFSCVQVLPVCYLDYLQCLGISH